MMAASLAAGSCAEEVAKAEGAGCRDDAAALRLKGVAMATILVAGVVGVGLPLAGRKRRALRTDSAAFVAAKAFAAGVILATGFVHMLHDAEHALSNPCLPHSPWRRFPFPGFVAMLAALATLVVDFVGTHFYERKHRQEEAAAAAEEAAAALLEDGGALPVGDGEGRDGRGGKRDAMHIVGIHAHAAAHRHSHAHVHGACHGGAVNDAHAHGHGHGHEEGPSARHVVVSQVRTHSANLP